MNCNNETSNILLFRHHTKKSIRALLDEQGFIEIDTPYLLPTNTPDPFVDPLMVIVGEERFQLHTSPEIWLKKALTHGLPKIYHMARVFRDDPPTRHHSREFVMLEWYRAGAKLVDLIKDCEEIFHVVHKTASAHGLSPRPIPPFTRASVASLFNDLAGLDLPLILTRISRGDHDLLQKILLEMGDHLPRDASFCDAFFHVMLKYVEPNLPVDQPVVIDRWPVQLAALAAGCSDDPLLCERFEIYFGGVEIANAYQECADPDVLRSRFVADNIERRANNKPIFPIDEDFLESIRSMPESAGIALGIDRLMLATIKKEAIGEIIYGYFDR